MDDTPRRPRTPAPLVPDIEILIPTPGRKHRCIRPPPPLHANPVPETCTASPLPPDPSIGSSAGCSHSAGSRASAHYLQIPAAPLTDDAQRVPEPSC